MRVIEERETYVHFDKDVDGKKSFIKALRGGRQNHLTLDPTSLVVRWRKRDGGSWECTDITIYGNRVTASGKPYGSEYLGIYYGGERSDAKPIDELPEWAAKIVAQTFPGITATLT